MDTTNTNQAMSQIQEYLKTIVEYLSLSQVGSDDDLDDLQFIVNGQQKLITLLLTKIPTPDAASIMTNFSLYQDLQHAIERVGKRRDRLDDIESLGDDVELEQDGDESINDE